MVYAQPDATEGLLGSSGVEDMDTERHTAMPESQMSDVTMDMESLRNSQGDTVIEETQYTEMPTATAQTQMSDITLDGFPSPLRNSQGDTIIEETQYEREDEYENITGV